MKQHRSITDSEWQVMRVLWENNPQTAGQITKTLSEVTKWEPTTVQTFLSRLVKKEMVAFEKWNKGHSYFPTVSERFCVQQEMNAVLNRIYGGKIHVETAHFRFLGDNPFPYLNKLASALEKQFPRLTQDLDFVLDDKQTVYVYSSQKRLHSALGLQAAPDWLRVGWAWDILHVAPEATFDDLAPEAAILHGFVQILVHRINETAPYWLHQGVAAYESGWLSRSRIIEALRHHPDQLNVGSVKDLTHRYDEFRNQSGYELAYTVAEFIVGSFGTKVLQAFLRTPESFSSVFGCEESRFWQDWLTFVKKTYIEGGDGR